MALRLVARDGRPRPARRDARPGGRRSSTWPTATRDDLAADYTYLQPAQPTSIGHLLLAYAYPALRDAERMRGVHGWLDLSVAGVGGSAGSRWPLDRERLAELLGCAGRDDARQGRHVAGRRLRRARRRGRDRGDPRLAARPGPRDPRQPGVRRRPAGRPPQPRERADAAEAQPLRARRHPHPGRHRRGRPGGDARGPAHRLGPHRPLPPAQRQRPARARRGRRGDAPRRRGGRRA